MEILEYIRPQSLDEAFHLVRDRRGTAIGGAAWLRTNTKTVPLGVDLAGLGLEYIREEGGHIEVGAMTTYHELETSPLLNARFGRLFADAVGHVVGVQLRNIITVGGTVAGRYGFSDLNTTLCALGAKVVLYPERVIDLAEFIEAGASGPFMVEKILLPIGAKGAYRHMRITENDFPILNVAVAWISSGWRIAVGARPAAARLCRNAMAALGSDSRPSDAIIEAAGRAAADELQFGSDIRAGAEYRREIAPVLVRRALAEVRA